MTTSKANRVALAAVLTSLIAPGALAQTLPGDPEADYRLLATTRTSTMERELNEAAGEGFRLVTAMGGETEFGGRELVVVMERELSAELPFPYAYRVLATNRTGTMQRELEDASRLGFVFAAQTVFETERGGREVVVILERSPDPTLLCDYELLATRRTSTMEKEIRERAARGFFVRGLSVAETAFGGKELVVVTERCFEP